MTVRQRQAMGGATASGANGVEAGRDPSAHFSWEDWFAHASAQQRADALLLAQRQGVLYPHQLPPGNNGVKTAPPSAAESPARSLVAGLLAGNADPLPALSISSLSCLDADLDDLQRHAVSRALASPDVFLIQGLPGTGKSRVVAEILRQLASQGQRALFVANHSSSVDVVLERLADQTGMLALRFRDTRGAQPNISPCLLRFTLEEQQRGFLERTAAGARDKHDQAIALCGKRGEQECRWADLDACLRRWFEVQARTQALDGQLANLRATVACEADAPESTSAFALAARQLRQSLNDQLQALTEALAVQRAALAHRQQEAAVLTAQLAAKEPRYLAKKHGKFWTPAYWAALFDGQIVAEVDALLIEQAQTRTRLQEITREIDRLSEECQRQRAQADQERESLLNAETETRRVALQQFMPGLAAEQQQLDDLWSACCGQLDIGALEKSPSALESARGAWLEKKQHDDRQCQFAQHWRSFIEESGTRLAARLPSIAAVLAGTVSQWHADAKFRDAASGVNVVIVEDADALGEAELAKLSAHAPRTILVGASLAESPVGDARTAPHVWPRLWQTLAGDTGRWPCSWKREDGRLVCQLFPLAADDRQHLYSEGLADAPDIELCILHRPRSRPCLAQVVFAPACTFVEAFTFMVREVQEFPLQPLGATPWWSEDAQRHVRHFGPTSGRIHAWIDFEPGTRLGTVADTAGEAVVATCIEFDKAAGWDRAKAEAWLQRHRPARDPERAVFLQTPYRFAAPLAALVRGLVRPDDWLVGAPADARSDHAALEFTPVPAPTKTDWPRDGAGLELDLSAPRTGDRLPVGLRQGLPSRGFVNYPEAQAVIRKLEAWSRENKDRSRRVAVLALYEGQVELLRRLVEQSEILRARDFPLEIALPSRLHQRECETVFLSLTRSHSHRAVSFGDDANELPMAVTRARAQLFVFGDPGAICRRTAWHGPVDQLGPHAAEQELQRMMRLLAFLQAQSVPPIPTNLGTNGNRS